MWWTQTRLLPAVNEQVVGVADDEVAWWTRTDDGWYVSDKRMNIGHRDDRGPTYWAGSPRQESAPQSGNGEG